MEEIIIKKIDTSKFTTSENYTTSKWTIADALKVHIDDPTTTMPVIDYNFPVMDNSILGWDAGALRDIHGYTTTFKGWFVMWQLVVNKIDLTNKNIYNEWLNRNNSAYIGYWYSKDGLNWTFGGRLLNKSADLEPWEWSGSLVMREGTENTLDMFYTSVGPNPAVSIPSVSTGQIFADDTKVWFEGFTTTTNMFQADGIHEDNVEENPYWNFRDPHPFMNPVDGKIYCLYEGDVAGVRGEFTITDSEIGHVPPGYQVGSGAQYGAAAIGIARLESDYTKGDFSKWTQLDPLVTALGVNSQLERPHVVFKDDLTYIFSISHNSTYVGSSTGPDGVYGFVSRNGIFGPYEPMNSSGLVLGNPSTAPLETYSHFVAPDLSVQSFINYLPAAGTTDPYNPTTYRIGGTLAPTVRLTLEESSSFLTEVHEYGQIFSDKEWVKK